MGTYEIEVVSRFIIDCDDIDIVRENFEHAEVEVAGVTEVEFLDGTFTYEKIG